MPNLPVLPSSRFRLLLLVESRAFSRRLARILALTAPLLLLWTLLANALMWVSPHFYLLQLGALWLLTGTLQLGSFFPQGALGFADMQYLLLPVSPLSKYLVRIAWLLLLSPLMCLLFFVAWAPFCQWLSLLLLSAANFPFLPLEGSFLAGAWLQYAACMALCIPGVLFFRRARLAATLLLYAFLFGLLSLGAVLAGAQPEGGTPLSLIPEGLAWFMASFPIGSALLVGAGVLPLFLMSGYFLFRNKQLA